MVTEGPTRGREPGFWHRLRRAVYPDVLWRRYLWRRICRYVHDAALRAPALNYAKPPLAAQPYGNITYSLYTNNRPTAARTGTPTFVVRDGVGVWELPSSG